MGLVIYKFLINGLNYITGIAGSNLTNSEQITHNIDLYFRGILVLFAALPDTTIQLASFDGLIQVYRTCFAITVVFIIPILMIRRYSTYNKSTKIFLLFYLMSLLSTTYICIFGTFMSEDLAGARYLLIIQFFAVILSVCYVVDKINKFNKWYVICIIAALVVPILSSSYINSNIKTIYSLDSSKHLIKNEHPKKGLIKFLEENELSYGYASYWNAGVSTIISNNKVFVAGISLPDMKPNYLLSSEKWYYPSTYQGETFILLEQAEKESINLNGLNNKLGEPKKILTYQGYTIIVYDFNIASKLPGWPMNAGESISIPGADLPSVAELKEDGIRRISSDDNFSGIFTFGPYVRLVEGQYKIKLHYNTNSFENKWDIGYSDGVNWVQLDGGILKADQSVLETDLRIDNSNKSYQIEVRTFFSNKGELTVDNLEIIKVS